MIKNYYNIIRSIVSICNNWAEIIIKKIFNLKLEYIILKNGTKFYVGGIIPKADLSMLDEVWKKEFYNPDNFEIENSYTVFDIGANNGFFSIYAAQKASHGQVYSFEPLPNLYEKILKNVEVNHLHNVHVAKLAIGHSTSHRKFYLSDFHNGCHSLFSRPETNKSITVETISLRDFCRQNSILKIDFLKLDCEGAEYEILNKENADFIEKNVIKISMEYHDNINNHNHIEILKFLKKHNFSYTKSTGYIYARNKNK